MKERATERLRSRWSLIIDHIPAHLLIEGRGNLLKDYYRAQLRIARGQKIRAKGILGGLIKDKIFLSLEEQHEDLLAAIDFAARGGSNRRNFKGEPVEPLFRLNHS